MVVLSVDELLEKIGSFGRYQWTLLGFYGYVMVTVGTLFQMVVTFITAEPAWMCVKGYNQTVCNFTEPIALTSGYYEARCNMPREAWTYVEGYTSTVTEYDLVCTKSYLQSVAQSCLWAGMILGCIFGGYLTDKIGRRRTCYLGIVGALVATWIIVFPKYFTVYIVVRTFTGFALGLFNASGFVLITEFTGKMHRAHIGIGSFLFWVAGLNLLALLAYLLPNWRHLLLATAVFATPCLAVYWILPESVRWLLLNGKYDIAKKELSKVAKVNQRVFPDVEIRKPEVVKSGNFLHLFSNWETSKRTLISWNIWFTVSLVYYGVSFGSVDLGWNIYLTFALTSLVEIPSNLAAIYYGERFGRKKCTGIGLIFACLASIIAISIPYDTSGKVDALTIIRIIMAVMAKFFINLSFSMVYVWTVELFPTFIRGTALSTSSAWARTGSISASFVIWLIRVHPLLPFGIMGLCCFQSAVLTVFLPETSKRPTMEIMSDMLKKEEILLTQEILSQDKPVPNNDLTDETDEKSEDQPLV